MMVLSSNSAYNSLISNTRQRARRIPKKISREPYTYMIAADDRLRRFLRRMEGEADTDASGGAENSLRGIVR
jgi:alpha-D-ribose 1-methylphosphonate 5-triphosphate synthase subunit PhnI